MLRRQALRTIGASATSLAVFGSVSSGAAEEEGPQPLRGELPNVNVPEAKVYAFGLRDEKDTRDTGTFLTLMEGWVGSSDEDTRELLDNTRQTFTYDGQTFVLDEASDWTKTDFARYVFTHTDPPKAAGERFELTWDVIATDEFFDPLSDRTYEPGDRFRPTTQFPKSNTYEIVPEDESG